MYPKETGSRGKPIGDPYRPTKRRVADVSTRIDPDLPTRYRDRETRRLARIRADRAAAGIFGRTA